MWVQAACAPAAQDKAYVTGSAQVVRDSALAHECVINLIPPALERVSEGCLPLPRCALQEPAGA